MKRLHILDCFVKPYNHTILKAFQNKTEFMPLYTVNSWWSFQEKHEEQMPTLLDTPCQDLLINHKAVSLAEFYALADGTKIRDIRGSVIEYVSTYMTSKPKFKKISVETTESYELPGIGHFQMVSNNVQRHKGRLNGDKVLLVESCLW